MPKVEGLKAVIAELQKRGVKSRKEDQKSVTVGFTQRYGLYVHEDMEAYHKVGMAKFLEKPARELAQQIGDVVRKTYKATKDMAMSLIMGGLRLQREAQIRTPVDTGALKASAFTCLTEDTDQTATEAFRKSEQVRKSTLNSRAKKASKKKGKK